MMRTETAFYHLMQEASRGKGVHFFLKLLAYLCLKPEKSVVYLLNKTKYITLEAFFGVTVLPSKLIHILL